MPPADIVMHGRSVYL